MNKKLLNDLFRIPSQSFEEEKTIDFLENYLKKISIPFEKDEMGNIYGLNYAYAPIICAHMDTVQDNNDVKMSKFIKIYGNIVKGYGVIGADDKAGIYAILDLLENGERINFLFTVSEETGGQGIQYFIEDHDISLLPYGLVIDRRGNGDIICERNEYGTKDFADTLELIGASFGFKKSNGTFSDADFLNEQISCANLSCGYYGAHTKHEFLKLDELQNSINFVHTLVKNVDQKFRTPEKTFKYNNLISLYENDFDFDGSTTFRECNVCRVLSSDVEYFESIDSYLCPECLAQLIWEIDSKELFNNEYDYMEHC